MACLIAAFRRPSERPASRYSLLGPPGPSGASERRPGGNASHFRGGESGGARRRLTKKPGRTPPGRQHIDWGCPGRYVGGRDRTPPRRALGRRHAANPSVVAGRTPTCAFGSDRAADLSKATSAALGAVSTPGSGTGARCVGRFPPHRTSRRRGRPACLERRCVPLSVQG